MLCSGGEFEILPTTQQITTMYLPITTLYIVAQYITATNWVYLLALLDGDYVRLEV
jgi:hypothetical protein